MKQVFFLFGLILISFSSGAQNWQYDLNKALKDAAVQNKNVLLFFSVQEQCSTCLTLEKNIFSSVEFQNFATNHYVLVKIDFSDNAKEENLLIVEKYNKDGFFPWVVVLNRDSKIIGKIGIYKNETPMQYLNLLQSFSKT